MKNVTAFNPPSIGDDEHIIRRLGWAVVKRWSQLSSETQADIREQAIFTEDRHAAVQLSAQIDAFVRQHGGESDM